MGIATRVNGTPPPEVALADIDLGSWDFWAADDDFRDGAFATLRREAPISFWSEPVQPGFPVGAGHWALTKYDDVFYASRHPEIFSSHPNITIADQPVEVAEYFGSMIALDDPRHQRLRSIVSRAFTPKVVARTEASVRDRAHRLVAEMIARHPDGRGELVSELSGPLPLQVICDMMGIPEEDHQRVFHWTNVILGFGDPDLGTDFEEFTKVSLEIGGLRERAGRRPPGQSPRRPDHRAGAGRRRRRPVVLGRDRLIFHPAGGGRQRDNTQRDQPRRAGADPLPRAAGEVVGRL